MSTLSVLFHKAWGQAHGSPDYDKKVWTELDLLLFEKEIEEHILVDHEAREALKEQAKQIRDWKGSICMLCKQPGPHGIGEGMTPCPEKGEAQG